MDLKDAVEKRDAAGAAMAAVFVALDLGLKPAKLTKELLVKIEAVWADKAVLKLLTERMMGTGEVFEKMVAWKKAEVVAAGFMHKQGFTVLNVKRNVGNGFDGLAYNDITGEVMIMETKYWFTKDVREGNLTALGLGSGGKAIFDANVAATLEKVNTSALSDAAKTAIADAFREGKFTVQFFGGDKAFPIVFNDFPWLKQANVREPIYLGPVPTL